ncbi:MAG: HD domain-containing protein, partial [Candidatus Aenigmatarchaeota archaeon]
GFSRYEHSLGVFLLLKGLNADLKEQVAGLIHDASHTALSHVIDWAVDNEETEDFHDKKHEEYINETAIPQILSEHGFNIDEITDYENFTLLERDIPEVCADRVDYSLRELERWGESQTVDRCLEGLEKYRERLVFNNRKTAKEFAKNFLKLQTEHWGGAEGVLRFHLLGQALKKAMDKGFIQMDDFYEDDEYIINKLKKNGDEDIHEILELLRGDINYETGSDDPDFLLNKKFRHVDPEYLENGEPKRLSETDEDYRKLLEEKRKENKEGIRIKLLSSTAF